MGRKLTSYERLQRDREREREKKKQASEVAARRAQAKEERERAAKENKRNAKNEVGKFDKFIDQIKNLQKQKHIPASFVKDFLQTVDFDPSKFEKPTKPKFKFKPTEFNFSKVKS